VLLGWVNVCILGVITSIVIFLFWKTNYRIVTVADRRKPSPSLAEHPMLSIHHHGQR
jgi:hypothetical protein